MTRGAPLIALALLACQGSAPARPEDRPVATIFALEGADTKKPRAVVTVAEYRLELAQTRFGREGKLSAMPLSPELKAQILERMIVRKVLAIEARKMDVKVSTVAVARELEIMRASMSDAELQKALLASYHTEADMKALLEERMAVGRLLTLAVKVEIDDEDLHRAWSERPEAKKVKRARVRASQIVVRTEEEAKQALADLQKTKDFAQVAARRSIGPEAARGGELGWFEAEEMPRAISDACFKMKPGEISPAVASEYGFHIFKVHAKEPEETLSFESAKEELTQEVLRKKLEAGEAAYVTKVRAAYRVVKDEKLLSSVE